MLSCTQWFFAGTLLLAVSTGPVFAEAEPEAEPVRSPPGATEAVTTQQAAHTPPIDDAAALAQLEAEIDEMLTPDGLVAPPPEGGRRVGDAGTGEAATPPQKRLEQIASTSNTIARNNPDQPRVQYQAQQVEMRAYHALAQDAVVNDRAAEASYRLTQLRNAATQTRQSENRFAAATGDFWLLLADLIDINRNVAALPQRQAKATAKLEAYLTAHEVQATPEPITTQVKAALIRLHHQSGNNARACELLAELREELPADDPRRLALADAAAVCELIGEAVAIEVTTLAGERWTSASIEQPVLVHFYADWSPQSVALFEVLAARGEALAQAKTRRLSISIGPTTRKAGDQPWPVAESSLALDGPAQRLGVKGLPWLILLDGAGQVVAVGQSEAVIDRALAAPQDELGSAATKPNPERAESP